MVLRVIPPPNALLWPPEQSKRLVYNIYNNPSKESACRVGAALHTATLKQRKLDRFPLPID